MYSRVIRQHEHVIRLHNNYAVQLDYLGMASFTGTHKAFSHTGHAFYLQVGL
jgi:hypothetical protein